MNHDERLMEIFMDIQRGLPRQGPGLNESTARAFGLCVDLPREVLALDVGCGPGVQTLVLGKALNGHIIAVDIYEEYLTELAKHAADAGLSEKVEVRVEDMNRLPFPLASFDLIWAEGSAYIMGFKNALTTWKPLLKVNGYIMVSELVWLRTGPPAEVKSFFEEEYPDMKHVAEAKEAFVSAGYELVGHFTLPDDGWWAQYYTPLNHKLPQLLEKYAQDSDALRIIEMTRTEIDMRRKYAAWYGYEYFVGRVV